MVDDRGLSGAGVSLLSLYGEDRREYARKQQIRPPVNHVSAMVKKVHRNKLPTMEGYDERMGAFLPGLMKVVKKVGKVTSGVTTGIAKAVGVPQSALNALAHIDPTKKNPSATQAITSLTTAPKTIEPVPFSVMGMDKKKLLIVGGSAVGGLVLLKLLMSPRPSR